MIHQESDDTVDSQLDDQRLEKHDILSANKDKTVLFGLFGLAVGVTMSSIMFPGS